MTVLNRIMERLDIIQKHRKRFMKENRSQELSEKFLNFKKIVSAYEKDHQKYKKNPH